MATTYNNLYLDLRTELRRAGDEEATQSARELVCAAAAKTREELVRDGSLYASPEVEKSARELVKRHLAGEPVAYLIGEWEFYGLPLDISPAVLIPRPETELLVELALAHFAGQRGVRVLDMGTGSGALAVTLALEMDTPDVIALDRSREALWVAMANAAKLGASVSIVQSDWFAALGDEQFALIVSNPPYIAAADPHLEQGDVRFEPRSALAAGPQGLDDLAEIVAGAPARLIDGGWLFLEHGYDQSVAARSLLADAGFAAIASWTDLAGIERVTGGRWLGRRG